MIGERYRIDHELGAGGFGRVFAVTDLRTGGRWALKLMSALDARRQAAFRDEAFASNVVAERSSHVVRVHDAQVDPRGAFIVMELLEGETLGRCVGRLRAQGKRLSTADALSVLRQVAHALDAAHACHIVHCDIKPENVFLSRRKDFAGGVHVHVLDFGIAKLRSDLRPFHTVTTAIGTPQWMPPERYDGVALPASDVYSFALLAVFALVGQPLARTERQRACAWASSVGVVLPAEFGVWLERATRDSPQERFATVREALAALELAMYAPRANASPPVIATPSSGAAQSSESPSLPATQVRATAARTSARRMPRRWGAVAAALLVAGGSAAWKATSSTSVGGDRAGGAAVNANSTNASTLSLARTSEEAPLVPLRALPSAVACSGEMTPALESLLLRWSERVRRNRSAQAEFDELYWPLAMVRPVSENLLPPSQIASIRARLNREGRALSFDLRQCRVEREDLSSRGEAGYANARAACGDGVVTKVVLSAQTQGYACTHNSPGRPALGEYIVRLRRDERNELRICYEAWSNEVDRAVCRRQ